MFFSTIMGYFRIEIPKYHILYLLLWTKEEYFKKEMYNGLLKSEKAQLLYSDLNELRGEPHVIPYGALVICRSGEMDMSIDFRMFRLEANTIIILFPGDMIHIHKVSDNFMVEMLRYDKMLLREASVQLEQTIYSYLRNDRCRGGEQVILDIFEAIFKLIRLHFEQEDCQCKDQLVLYQLKSFFLGFYDYLRHHQDKTPQENGSQRLNELFTLFMETLERDYKKSHEVAYYAHQLHITPKYLYTISMKVSGQTPKTLINHYLIMQIKLHLRTSDTTIKEMAWQYHFSDVSFFCRHFRECTGMTPQEYRRKYKEE